MHDPQRKGEAFRALHAGEPFVIPNPWDAGSARVLEALGFKAVASTSSGFAFTQGRLDGNVTLDQVVQHAEELDRAIGLPVSIDLEHGYGREPERAAHAVERVAKAGAVGASIEDNDPSQGIYEISYAVDRIASNLMLGFFFPGATLEPLADGGSARPPVTFGTPSAA